MSISLDLAVARIWQQAAAVQFNNSGICLSWRRCNSRSPVRSSSYTFFPSFISCDSSDTGPCWMLGFLDLARSHT
jgi:hypothetical protein